MRKFLINIFYFLLIGLMVGEVIARVLVLSSDIPRRTVDKNGIQKYIPNQKGSWKSGSHSWQINKTGWPGPLPLKYDNIVTIIGDSYIENFMNPDSCHQSVLLANRLDKYNYLEASRSGINLLEAMQIANQLDTLKPTYQLLYVHESDFEQSILNIKKINTINQLDLNTNTLVKAEMKSPILKRILYNWKFVYFIFNKYLAKAPKKSQINSDIFKKNFDLYKKLLKFIQANFSVENKILVFRPGSKAETISLAKDMGFQIITLKEPKNSGWSFDYDSHWNCFGHDMVSKQVATELKNLSLSKTNDKH